MRYPRDAGLPTPRPHRTDVRTNANHQTQHHHRQDARTNAPLLSPHLSPLSSPRLSHRRRACRRTDARSAPKTGGRRCVEQILDNPCRPQARSVRRQRDGSTVRHGHPHRTTRCRSYAQDGNPRRPCGDRPSPPCRERPSSFPVRRAECRTGNGDAHQRRPQTARLDGRRHRNDLRWACCNPHCGSRRNLRGARHPDATRSHHRIAENRSHRCAVPNYRRTEPPRTRKNAAPRSAERTNPTDRRTNHPTAGGTNPTDRRRNHPSQIRARPRHLSGATHPRRTAAGSPDALLQSRTSAAHRRNRSARPRYRLWDRQTTARARGRTRGNRNSGGTTPPGNSRRRLRIPCSERRNALRRPDQICRRRHGRGGRGRTQSSQFLSARHGANLGSARSSDVRCFVL